MIKRYCDKCKKEIEDIEESNKITFSIYNTERLYKWVEEKSYELCNKCYMEEINKYK